MRLNIRIVGLAAGAAAVLTLVTFSAGASNVLAAQATMAATMAPTINNMMMAGPTLSTALVAIAKDGTPKNITIEDWTNAFAVAEMTMGSTGSDTIIIKAGKLVPNGLYTAWWVNMKPTMTMGPAGTANSFKTDVNGYGTITITVPSENDYQTLFIVYHADGKTHGTGPGKMGSESFSQLMGEFPGPGSMASSDMAATMVATTAK